jgi:RNA polymerase sigma-70 factor (ECF subfamily)
VNAISIGTARDRDQLVTQWFAEYQMPLARYLLRLLSDEDQAADVLQDTFLRAHLALAKQEPPDNPFAWLHRIATNLAYNALRRRMRWRWLRLSGHERTNAFEPHVATAQAVQRCLARLSPAAAEVLLLYEHVGLSCLEIAALRGQPAPLIRLQLQRARERFRQHYEKECR